MDLEEAKQLHAACYDNDLGIEDTRLMLYIHCKTKKNVNLRDPCQVEIDALCVMLGLSDFRKELGEAGLENVDLSKFGESVVELDRMLESKCGVEYYMRGQLENQLRFHVNKEYQEKYLVIYETRIAPVISSYDATKVANAFQKFNTKSHTSNPII